MPCVSFFLFPFLTNQKEGKEHIAIKTEPKENVSEKDPFG